jgi:two-component system OmpR family sensor kinase
MLAGLDRATRLVEQMLVLARHDSAAPEPAPQPVNLVDVAHLVISDLLAPANRKAIDLGMPASEALEVSGRTEALRTLLRNLVDNAIRYTPAGGVVDVSVQRENNHAAMVVEDNGPGISEADRARAFDRFYRVAGNDATGSGLGLAIVQAIAEKHGASVSLDASPRLGGLRVTVAFPG